MPLRLRSLLAGGRSALARVPLGLVVFELFLVFVALAGALLANGWWQARSEALAARGALEGIRSEMRANREQIEQRIEKHQAVAAAAEGLLAELAAGQPPPASIHALRERLIGGRGLATPLLSRAAWEGSLASGQLRSIPVQELQAVAAVYELQHRVEKLVDSLMEQFVKPEYYRSDRLPEAATALLVASQILVELERQLLQAYPRFAPPAAPAAPMR